MERTFFVSLENACLAHLTLVDSSQVFTTLHCPLSAVLIDVGLDINPMLLLRAIYNSIIYIGNM